MDDDRTRQLLAARLGLPAVRLNVLTRYAHFAVTEQSPVGQRLSLTRAQTLLVAVGRVVARAFH